MIVLSSGELAVAKTIFARAMAILDISMSAAYTVVSQATDAADFCEYFDHIEDCNDFKAAVDQVFAYLGVASIGVHAVDELAQSVRRANKQWNKANAPEAGAAKRAEYEELTAQIKRLTNAAGLTSLDEWIDWAGEIARNKGLHLAEDKVNRAGEVLYSLSQSKKINLPDITEGLTELLLRADNNLPFVSFFNNTQDVNKIARFAEDLDEGGAALVRGMAGEPGWIRAWDVLSDYPAFRKNTDYLDYTNDYFARTGKTKQQFLDDLDDFEDPKYIFLDELGDTPASGTYANNPSGVWNENPFRRGREIEDVLGQNLHDNFPYIDKFDPFSGAVTSIKSTDTYAKTYQLADNLEGLWKKYVDNLTEMPPPNTPIVFADDIVQGYTKQILEIAVPDPLTAGQNSVLNSVINYSKGKGVNGTDIEIIIQVIE